MGGALVESPPSVLQALQKSTPRCLLALQVHCGPSGPCSRFSGAGRDLQRNSGGVRPDVTDCHWPRVTMSLFMSRLVGRLRLMRQCCEMFHSLCLQRNMQPFRLRLAGSTAYEQTWLQEDGPFGPTSIELMSTCNVLATVRLQSSQLAHFLRLPGSPAAAGGQPTLGIAAWHGMARDAEALRDAAAPRMPCFFADALQLVAMSGGSASRLARMHPQFRHLTWLLRFSLSCGPLQNNLLGRALQRSPWQTRHGAPLHRIFTRTTKAALARGPEIFSHEAKS